VGVGAPSGTVTFYSGSSVLIASALNGSVATAIVSSLPAGPHSITAVYSNTTSNAVAVTINKAVTAVKLASTVTKTTAGSVVVFMVTASARSNVAAPAGTVTLSCGKTLLGTITLHNGAATLSTRSLAAGADTISAVYSGDLNYLNATSNPVTVTVVLPSAAVPALSLAPGTYTKPQSVKLSAATAGATIYYTTNGAEPTTASARYSGAIKVSSTETIKAMAAAAGYANSTVASATYTIATSPSVTTRAATALTASAATLNGSVSANNATTQYWFAYGTSKTALTSKTAKTGALTAAAPTAVTAPLTGLKTKTTYYFQIVASNAAGTTSGATQSFTTH
jgi:hypothetical protein